MEREGQGSDRERGSGRSNYVYGTSKRITMDANTVKEIIYKKYSYLGSSYMGIPAGWIPLVMKLITDIDKLARPWWLPRIVANMLRMLACGKSVVQIRSLFWYRVWSKLPIKCQITQIKDKFGGLRFYCSATDEIFDLVGEAEDKSYHICEVCGSSDDVSQTDTGWVYTYCRKCKIRQT